MSISSEITRLGGNISDSLDAVEDMGGTVPSDATSDDLPTAIRSIPQSGGSGTPLPEVTNDDDGKVLKASSGAWNKGYQSWNDLTDKPFYEETDPGYNLEIDLNDQNYVSGYFNIGTDIPAKFYRVGDPLTAAQLVGALGTVNNGGEENSHVIESNYIQEIEDNGDTVGLFVAGDMPYCLVINNANTTIDVDATNDRPFGCSGTFASAGTYLFWLDLSTMEEGTSAYVVSLVKDSTTIVHKIDSKYIPNDYNELSNKPCWTEHFAEETYEMPDMTSEQSVSGTFNGDDYLWFRVGNNIPSQNLIGATVTDYDEDEFVISSSHIQELKDSNGDVKGCICCDGVLTMYAVSIYEDNASIDCYIRPKIGSSKRFLANFISAGLYFKAEYLNEHNAYIEFTRSIIVPAYDVVHPIDSKYIDSSVKLPSITSLDNGKALFADNGIWSAKPIFYECTYELDYDSFISEAQSYAPGEGTGSFGNLTTGNHSEVIAAFNSGIIPILSVIFTRNGNWYRRYSSIISMSDNNSCSIEPITIDGTYTISLTIRSSSVGPYNLAVNIANADSPIMEVVISYDSTQRKFVSNYSYAEIYSAYTSKRKYIYGSIDFLSAKSPLIHADANYIQFAGVGLNASYSNDELVIGGPQVFYVFIDVNDNVILNSVVLSTQQ